MKKKKNYTRTDKAAYFFLLPAAVIYLSVIVAPVCYLSLIHISAHGAKKKIDRVDEERASFHRYYTHREWGRADAYELCLDSSVLGADKCAEVIFDYLKIRGLF